MFFPSSALTGLAFTLLINLSTTAPTSSALNKRTPTSSTLIKRNATVPQMAGAPVIFGSGTYPRANKLSSGSIIGVYTAFEGGDTVIRTVINNGGDGMTWTAQGEITRGATSSNDIDNPYILPLPGSNRIICAFRNHSKDPASGAYTTFRITITSSDDGGVTWQHLSQPATDPGPVTGNWEPFLRTSASGTLQLYYSRENSAQDQDTLLRTSSDGGASWSDARTISGDGITSRDGMTGVATIDGDNLMLVFESETEGLFKIMSITSPDDGTTWNNDRSVVYAPDSENTSAGAPQIVNVGGNLVVSFMTNEDQPNAVASSSYTSNTAAKIVVSGDGGKSWGGKVTVGAVQSVWPGLYDLGGSGGGFLMMFDNGGAKAQKITLG